ncbi:unnamed protein product [Linum tenue]|uniref:Uncharacterized protein n=1 Tax=Linum tenue TaxID=586396 RepID=A0AAV0KI61_9ROSI|nr:unnamed protein product [Linum tenue]
MSADLNSRPILSKIKSGSLFGLALKLVYLSIFVFYDRHNKSCKKFLLDSSTRWCSSASSSSSPSSASTANTPTTPSSTSLWYSTPLCTPPRSPSWPRCTRLRAWSSCHSGSPRPTSPTIASGRPTYALIQGID